MSKKELLELLTQLLGTLPPRVLSHIDILASSGLTYKEIARATYYIFDVMKQPIVDLDKWGIKGLVPIYVDKANKYYDTLKRQQDQQKEQVLHAGNTEIKNVKPQTLFIQSLQNKDMDEIFQVLMGKQQLVI